MKERNVSFFRLAGLMALVVFSVGTFGGLLIDLYRYFFKADSSFSRLIAVYNEFLPVLIISISGGIVISLVVTQILCRRNPPRVP